MPAIVPWIECELAFNYVWLATPNLPFLFCSVTASHVERSWTGEADAVNRVLSKPLEAYENVIDPENYKNLLAARKATKNKSWYSHNMTAEAAKYILKAGHIQAGLLRLQEKATKCAAAGAPMTEASIKEQSKTLISAFCSEWNVKIPKMTQILNPELGEYYQKCVELYLWAEETRKEGLKTDDPVKKAVQCGLDKCRLFTVHKHVSNELRRNLLEISVKPDMRATYHHPAGMTDNELKTWIFQCGVWETVTDLGHLALEAILHEILPEAPDERLGEAALPRDVSGLQESIMDDFHDYSDFCQGKMFPYIWQETKLPEHSVLSRRAMRLVYRFFMEKEASPDYFWMYPGCFNDWIVPTSDFTMYPAEGTNPPRQMKEWEYETCPWYLETDKWSKPIDHIETLRAKEANRKETPLPVRAEIKRVTETLPGVSAQMVEAELSGVTKRKPRKSRKPRVLAVSTTTKKKSSKTFYLLRRLSCLSFWLPHSSYQGAINN
jgi:hypothetical protein